MHFLGCLALPNSPLTKKLRRPPANRPLLRSQADVVARLSKLTSAHARQLSKLRKRVHRRAG